MSAPREDAVKTCAPVCTDDQFGNSRLRDAQNAITAIVSGAIAEVVDPLAFVFA